MKKLFCILFILFFLVVRVGATGLPGSPISTPGDGEGASAAASVSVADTEEYFTGENVETVLAEIYVMISGFISDEYIDWTADQGATDIHQGNIPSLTSVSITLGDETSPTTEGLVGWDATLDQLEIGTGSGTAVFLRSWYAYDVLPIAWAADGSSAPDALDDRSTRAPYQYRTFASDSSEDVNYVWFVPSDLSGSVVQYRVKYLVTNATGPSAEGVAFGLSGVSLGDNDATNGAKGTAVVITDESITAAQHDILITGWSGDVTITNLAAGEIAELNLLRDHDDAADDYAQVVGVLAVEIRYVRNVTR